MMGLVKIDPAGEHVEDERDLGEGAIIKLLFLIQREEEFK
jgi:hypothetical protein